MSNENEKKEWKYKDNVEKGKIYNIEGLDSSILKYSAAGIGLFTCMYDKFCSSSLNIYFAAGMVFFVISLICQLFSYKAGIVSHDYCLLDWEESDPEYKLKAFNRYDKAHRINVFLNYITLFSFSFACMSFLMMVLSGAK